MREYDADSKAASYLQRAATIPQREVGEALLLDRLPAGPLRVLDLGCGDGRLLGLVLDARPGSRGLAVDASPLMLERARERFAGSPDVEVAEHDLALPLRPEWGRFDAVVSSFAIHHLEHARKRELYAEVAGLLEPGGVFCDLEHVASPTAALHARFVDALGGEEDATNILLDVEAQLAWLRELGFGDVDCDWKWRELALIAGTAPLGPPPPPALHPLLAGRWSPTRFDPAHELTEAEVGALLEAARWAPSAGNSQPWAFVAGRRGDATHARLLRHLTPGSSRWAASASLLVANLSHRLVEDTDWEFSEFSLYDLGQAVAHMTLQARALGLFVRQFRAFDREGLERELDVPAHWEVTTMAAIGRVPAGAEPEPGSPARSRKPVDELTWPG